MTVMVDTAIVLNGTRVLCSTDDFGRLIGNVRYHLAGSNPAGPIGGIAPGKEYVVGPRRLA